MNKKNKLLIAIALMGLLLVALVVILFINAHSDALKGSWHISIVEGYDMSFEAKDMGLDNTMVEFNGKGTCTYKGATEDIVAEYKISNKTITFKDNQNEYTGKITDEDSLVINNFFGSGLKVTLIRDKANE